jgi:hypothetical protein
MLDSEDRNDLSAPPLGAGAAMRPFGRLTGSLTWLPAEWRDALCTGGGIWLIFTALRWITAVVTEFVSEPDHGRLHSDFPGWLLLFYNWDSDFYANIAVDGYFAGDRHPNVWPAFFPGLPLAMRGLAWVGNGGELTKFSASVAGVVLAHVFSLAATVMIFRLTSATFTRRAGVWSAVLLMTWPTAVFLNAAYTESLFLALAVGAWYSAWRGRWWLAGFLCAGASLIRLNGVLLAGALLVFLVVEMARRRTPVRVSSFLAVTVGVLGTAAYFFYLQRNTGDWMTWPNALEDGWHRHSDSLVEGFGGTLDRISVQTDPFQRAQSVVDVLTVVFLILFVAYLAWRRFWPELAFTAATLYTVAASPEYISVLRYTLTLFPLFVVGGLVLSRRREWVSAMLVTLSGVWMLVSTVLFTLDKWIG